jgi:hypothetical protein
MNTTLTKYLSEVFRNDVQENTDLEINNRQSSNVCIEDKKMTRFLVDGKYTLSLDEII